MHPDQLERRLGPIHLAASGLAAHVATTRRDTGRMSSVEAAARVHLFLTKSTELYNSITTLYEDLQRKPDEPPTTQHADARRRPGDEPAPS